MAWSHGTSSEPVDVRMSTHSVLPNSNSMMSDTGQQIYPNKKHLLLSEPKWVSMLGPNWWPNPYPDGDSPKHVFCQSGSLIVPQCHISMWNLIHPRQPQREALMNPRIISGSVWSDLGVIWPNSAWDTCSRFCQVKLPQQEALTESQWQVSAQVEVMLLT